MKWTFCAILGCLAQMGFCSVYPSDTLHVCGKVYTITAFLHQKHKDNIYTLEVEGSGMAKRTLKLGKIVGEVSRASILNALRDSLHKADLFPSCPGNVGEIDRNIDILINKLITEAFPNAHVGTVSEEIINDNNKLKLLQESGTGHYQISNITPTAEIALLTFDSTSLQYDVNWANISGTPVVLDNFDRMLLLYFKIPYSAVKPSLYLLFRPLDNDYEVIYSFDTHVGSHSKVILPKEMGSKLAGLAEERLMVDSVHPYLLKIADPYSPKKPKDAPTFKEQ